MLSLAVTRIRTESPAVDSAGSTTTEVVGPVMSRTYSVSVTGSLGEPAWSVAVMEMTRIESLTGLGIR